MNRLVQRLQLGGYVRTGTVMEPGEFACAAAFSTCSRRGAPIPCGSILRRHAGEHQTFDAETQRTHKLVQKLTLCR